ncbi:hypothetical protein [Flavisericum labens]|uniref:hypothetical protein n=1 Tax=Flavisericum labens TaxID=3377112 RepID=UPI00387AAF6B
MKNNILVYAIIFHHLFCIGQNSSHHNLSILNLVLTVEQDSITVSPQHQLSNWGYGVDLNLGYGLLSGDLENNLKNFITYGLSFTFEYKKIVVLGLGYSYGGTRTKEDIQLNGIVWENDLRANIHRGDLFIGHGLLNNKAFRMTPFFGMALIKITPHEPNNYDFDFEDSILYEKVRFDKLAYLFGLMLDIKTTRNSNESNISYGAIRLKYSYYMPHFEKKYSVFNGNIHCITVGIGGVSRKNKKK